MLYVFIFAARCWSYNNISQNHNFYDKFFMSNKNDNILARPTD